MRELDEVLFPRRKAAPRPTSWSSTVALPSEGPRTDTSGLPPSRSLDAEPAAEPTQDLSWLSALRLPDIPVRWEAPVVRYLDYYKNHPNGRQLAARWVQKSGRYRDAITRVLREHGMPEDILWLALIESAFNPDAYSRAGAAGLWQFMPATGRIYGLTVTRGIDERLDAERSTYAAVRHLKDLHQRFGSWELAFAAYNMGYGGLLSTIRKYNTNDYWELRRLEAALPYETALYVPKIVAMAVVAHNCDIFGCDGAPLDAPVPFDEITVGPGTSLDAIAEATGEGRAVLAQLNPQLRGSRTPPLDHAASPRPGWSIYVPRGKGAAAQAKIAERQRRASPWTTVRMRWGETTEDVARANGCSSATIEQLNDLARGEQPRPMTTIFVPEGGPRRSTASSNAPDDRPIVTVPERAYTYSDREQVFYRVVLGDELHDIARVTGTSALELRTWNRLDPQAKLQSGMLLQLYVRKGQLGDDVRVLRPGEVRVMDRGSDEFFTYYEGKKGRSRFEHTVVEGDTWNKIGRTYGLSLGMLERINHRGRRSTLQPGEKVVVYATAPKAPEPASAAEATGEEPGEDGREPAASETEPDAPTEPTGPPGGATSTG